MEDFKMKKIFRYISNCVGYMMLKHKMKVAIFEAFNHSNEWIDLITKLANAYKDATPEEIRNEFMVALTTKIHEDNQKKKDI